MKSILLLFIITISLQLQSQILFTPKIGFELNGFNSVAVNQIKRQDLRVTVLDFGVHFGAELGVVKKNNKFSFLVERKGFASAFRIINDSAIVPNTNPIRYSSNNRNSLVLGISSVYYGLNYDRIDIKSNLFEKLVFNYGFGVGIHLNLRKQDYIDFTNLSYYQSSWSGFNYTNSEVFTFRRGNGFNVKIRGGFAFLNKKKRAYLTLDAYWNQGFVVMNNYIVNYNYGTTNVPSTYRSVKEYKYNTRGTTAGVTLGFPIYLSKSSVYKFKK